MRSLCRGWVSILLACVRCRVALATAALSAVSVQPMSVLRRHEMAGVRKRRVPSARRILTAATARASAMS